jgi:hypothetical protein
VKGVGYLVSTVSVLLLGTVAWQGAAENPELKYYLIGGMATAILGMFLRFLSHERDRKRRSVGQRLPAPTAERLSPRDRPRGARS